MFVAYQTTGKSSFSFIKWASKETNTKY